MFYQIDNQKERVNIHDMNDDHMYIGMMSLDELKECYHELHISSRTIQSCEDSSTFSQNIIVPHRDYYFMLINLINARDVFVEKDSLAFFIFKNLFLVVVLKDEDKHIEEVFRYSSDYVLEQQASITRLVYYFLSELISKDYRYIEELQEEIEELENHDSDDESLLFSRHLRQLNKELLLLLNYYDALVTIGEELQMNHHSIFIEDDMRYFEIFTQRLERLSKSVEMLRELLNQARDAHQAKLDYKLNKTMQFFTVVTTIFLPLTLLTGWYGMNFQKMPELYHPYGYYAVMGVSVAIIVGLVYWFKKKKFF
ncbi:MAG: CorA family divalent cation transporter [Coprobacillus sp.]